MRSITDIFTQRLRQIVEGDPRSLNEIVRAAGAARRTMYAIGAVLRDGRCPSIETIWDIGEALGVHPLWLLGSELHAPPRPFRGPARRPKPDKLPAPVWARVAEAREAGRSWPQVCQLLREWHGLDFQPNGLRRAYARYARK